METAKGTLSFFCGQRVRCPCRRLTGAGPSGLHRVPGGGRAGRAGVSGRMGLRDLPRGERL